MKKSLLALAALGMFAGAASAQSSVTLFGIVDAGVARLDGKVMEGTVAKSRSVTGMTNSGLNSSRLGFRGVEDLGGGLRAGFHLEGAVDNDTGGAAFNFQRRSTVSLMGGFGEVRLGRDLTPTFSNVSAYDPFGTNGVGTSMATSMLRSLLGTTTMQANTRQDNSIQYFLPGNLGGFTGNFMYGFHEKTSGARKTDQYFGARLGYAAGPLSVTGAYGENTAAVEANDVKYISIGASYDVGVVKPMAYWAREKADGGARIDSYLLGATVPLGQGELRASIARHDIKKTVQTLVRENDWDKFAIGYGYNLSKRTQLYGTFAMVKNKKGQTKQLTNSGVSGLAFPGTIQGGSTMRGLETGIRHLF